MSRFIFGVDVGGTTVKLGFFDIEGNVLDKWEIPTRTEESGSKIIPDIAKSILSKIKEKDIFIMVTAFGQSSIDIVCKVYVKWDSYETLRCRLNEKIKLAFDENKIEIPYSQIDVHMK